MKIIGLIIIAVFYLIYIGKLLLQKKKGIQTDQIARGKEKNKVFYIELILKIATYLIVPVEVISIFVSKTFLPQGFVIGGVVLGIVGDIIFATAVFTMKDSWRAGIAENNKTEMVTDGIYKISRNPAFLGFDCVYLGIMLMFFNWVLWIFTLFAMVMLHLQILQEEKYLEQVFGEEYVNYKSIVCRYIGRK
jgi:protein-S-isoprenylcysteine O-methyltransferase Ste14